MSDGRKFAIPVRAYFSERLLLLLLWLHNGKIFLLTLAFSNEDTSYAALNSLLVIHS